MAPGSPPTDDQIRTRLNDLKLPLDPGIKYRLTNLFPKLDGWFINSSIKTKAKLIREMEHTLEEILQPGEEVLYIAKGIQQAFLETFFMGALWAQMINQTGFVFTNARVLMMRTNGKGKPLKTFWMIYYSEIVSVKGGWAGSLTVKLKDRRTLAFGGFPKADRQAIERIVEEAIENYQQTGFAPDTTQSLEDLCCHCFDTVPKNDYECPECGATFWKPSQLAIRSLIFPSWGDFLMGHYAFACFELLGYIVGLGFVLLSVSMAISNPQGDSVLDAVLVAIAFFAMAHVMDASLTYIVANKGLNPRIGPQPHSAEDGED
ncbi:MAG: hypothetical protein DWH91_04325 [Planctomycetota bacterium]|nr:MAG: hypothetical protein DWH91_04325 [Planctomycetota bacterium]